MTEMHRIITSNPRINCFYRNGRHLYPYGNTPSKDLTGGCEINSDVDFLLLASGDIRNVLFTVKTLSELKIKPKTLNFHVNDNEDVILARNLIILAILDQIQPENNEDMEYLWSIWYDMAISKESLQKLRRIIEELLDQTHQRVKFMTDDCNENIREVLKYWLDCNLTLKKIKRMRNKYEEKLLDVKKKESSLISDAIYGEEQHTKWTLEVENFLKEGSTYREEHVQGANNLVLNPTLISPVDGWRVQVSGTPFHSYNLLGLTEEQSLFENCLSQLMRLVQAWKQCTICLKVSFWLGDCLTLCNHVLPPKVKFDFIDTSNVEDHVGLLNLLASCSSRLKISGVLTTETLRWQSYFTSMEDYLTASIGIPVLFFPTILGLCLAEDFAMGTSEPRRLSEHIGSAKVDIRWLKAREAGEKININDSPDLLKAFTDLLKSCMLLDFPPLFASAKTPSSLVHVIRTMKDNVVGGAKALLDIVLDAQPKLETACGNVFYPHENCLRVAWLAYRDELGCDWPKDDNEMDILVFEIYTNPVQITSGGSGSLYMGKIYSNCKDETADKSVEKPLEPWYFITSINSDMEGKITFLLPSHVWSFLKNSANLTIYSKYDKIFASKNIKNDSSVKQINCISISTKQVAIKEIRKCLNMDVFTVQTVKEYEDRYEMHINLQDNINQSHNSIAELGSDPTEVLLKCEKGESTYRLICPLAVVRIVQSEPGTLHITAEKNLDVLKGPVILKYRCLDIGNFPTEGNSIQQLVRILSGNEQYQERTREKKDDVQRNISLCVRQMLSLAKEKQNEQNQVLLFVGDQTFDHDPDIFISFNKLHIIDEIVTLSLNWIDFKTVDQNIRAGKLKRTDVDKQCPKQNQNCCKVTSAEAVLLRKWLLLNARKSKQEQQDHKYQWQFSSFLQPLYAINDIVDPQQISSFTGSSNKELGGSPLPATDLSQKMCSYCSESRPDLKACTGCRKAFYCGKECQRSDWHNHKLSCKPSTV